MEITKQKEALITGLTIQLDRAEYEQMCRTCKFANSYKDVDSISPSVLKDLAGSYIEFLNNTVGQIVLYPTLDLSHHELQVTIKTPAGFEVLTKILLRYGEGVSSIKPKQVGPYKYSLGKFLYKDTERLRLEFSKRGIEFISVPVYAAE